MSSKPWEGMLATVGARRRDDSRPDALDVKRLRRPRPQDCRRPEREAAPHVRTRPGEDDHQDEQEARVPMNPYAYVPADDPLFGAVRIELDHEAGALDVRGDGLPPVEIRRAPHTVPESHVPIGTRDPEHLTP
ncbi:hypothetical protein ACFY7Y_36865 [Streptomyces virginiae]|uniref:hypothetical protein n=1 Tax=Streptomyces virginiae TaxID=1961 RepID=UPI00367D100E